MCYNIFTYKSPPLVNIDGGGGIRTLKQIASKAIVSAKLHHTPDESEKGNLVREPFSKLPSVIMIYFWIQRKKHDREEENN